VTTPGEPGQISLRDLVNLAPNAILCSACGSRITVTSVQEDGHVVRPADSWVKVDPWAVDLEAMLKAGVDHLARAHNYPETPVARADRIMRDVIGRHWPNRPTETKE
jgi:hypothetical protein